MTKKSPCKVNLLLNILGRRADGFHELETIMQPVNLCDELAFESIRKGIELSCSDPALPADSRNLVYRAAERFIASAGVSGGVRIRLEKKIPLAAGLGGGSGNAATTLLALNELFDHPLPGKKLFEIAASLGSDVPFFLQEKPALAVGRGENIQPLENFPALKDKAFLLIHPGFGIATPWAYQNRGVKRAKGPRAGIDFTVADDEFENGRRRVLQFARSAGPGKISHPEIVPGVPVGGRRPGCPDVGQRLDDVCDLRRLEGGGCPRGTIQIKIWRELLDGGRENLTKPSRNSASATRRTADCWWGKARPHCDYW
jgi:4-diphosphocytidyl-2C-methyl-D-erythritol kinase